MIARRIWVFDPQSGGNPIPKSLHQVIIGRLNAHAEKNYPGKYQKLDITFRGRFCHLGFYSPVPPRTYKPFRISYEEYLEYIATHPVKMARMRYFSLEEWSCAFFAYSTESYKPCLLRNGEWIGRMEDCFDVGTVYFE